MPARPIARIALAAAMLMAIPAFATAAPPPVETYEYTANLDPLGASLRPPPAAGIYNSDLAFWGDTAYQGTYDGFRIIDASNPNNPTSLIDYDECAGSQGDVIIWDHLLVRSWNSQNTSPTATCDGEAVPLLFEGLHIFDVTNPADPALLGSVDLPTCGSHTATGVPDPANNRLLVYNNPSAGTPQCTGFDIIEIPLDAPETASQIGDGVTGRSCHDTAVILGDAMKAMCSGGNGFTMMSLGGEGGGALDAPVLLYTKDLTTEMVTIGHAASFSWDGSIAIFGHEPGGGSDAACEEADDERLRTIFFFNAADGEEVGRWVLPKPQEASENCTIHNFNTVPSARKNILVSGNYQAGTWVVDFTDPANAVDIAHADPAPLDPQQLGGDWSTYWYDGIIYEGDITRGLITWRLDDPAVGGAQTLGHLNPQTQEKTIALTGGSGLTCKGKRATIEGTNNNDTLVGTPQRDVIAAGGGDDTVRAISGNDLVCGGAGNDALKGGGGTDRIFGQAGRDTLTGGPGQGDKCVGGGGRDTRGRGCEKGKV